MIRAFYILTPGGIPVFYYDPVEKKDALADAILFTGLITAIQNFLVEVEIGAPKQFTTNTREVYIKTTDCFGLVLVKDQKDDISTDDVQQLLKLLVNKLDGLIPDKQSCDVVDDTERRQIREIVDKILVYWKEIIKESKASKKMKEGLW
ncbi:MAG: hypothetical protein H7647_11295 [Candidatus Heimdallarchaeota archaeon]|nr:hypothetical protein [Candidatus Heimdallarchaeota archaeon]MCK4255012.1 hypothetical protein [Candidatus Heimdallarchaeota archaeon]